MSHSYAPRERRTADDFDDPDCWEEHNGGYLCRACDDGSVRQLKNVFTHQKTAKHRTAVAQYGRDRQLNHQREAARSISSTQPTDPYATVNMLTASLEASRALRQDVQQQVSAPIVVEDPISLDLDCVDFGDDSNLIISEEERVTNAFAEALHQGLTSGIFIGEDSDSDNVEPTLSEESEDDEPQDGIARARGPLRHRMVDPSAPFFPYTEKPEFSLDTVPHLTRSGISDKQMDLFAWCMRFNGVTNLPSVSAMKNVHKYLQATFGIETVEYMGKMGHRYCVNSLSDIIAQEHANPLVGPHLQYLPVDNSASVGQAFEARKWLHEINPHLATPMIRRGNQQDFYIFEPVLLSNGEMCIPYRWFIRGGERYACAWRLTVETYYDPRTGREMQGFCAHEYETIDVSEHRFLLSMPELSHSHRERNIPHPSAILGSYITLADLHARRLSPWSHTDPSAGNPRRAQAQGCEVRACPFWLYCDDTSGNQSKKWNKHNSFLFSCAGLPRERGHQEYNVHFLATSNTAPVPEMLDGVVSEIEKAQEHGIWAFDFVTRQIILIIPFVLGLLGDNPMQSELSCHIGLRGRYFCRTCWVYKRDGTRPADGDDDSPDDTEGSDDDLPTSSARKKVKETAAEMLARVKRFTSIAPTRHRQSTLDAINEVQAAAMSANGQERAKSLKTQYGVKDTALQYWIDKLATAMKGKRGAARQAAFERAHAQLPQDDLRSAIWRLKGLDPNCDTPVEVLHVILLGIVKYFWRDVVKNHCKSDAKRRLLIAHIDSFDTSGLGISPLSGHSLVTYAGSLVGRDFRTIIQVAPFILHGLVPTACYNAWLALAALVPVVWVPEIRDVDAYCTRLTTLINNLLAATAAWTPKWFNKPKFHVLLHLPHRWKIPQLGSAPGASRALEALNQCTHLRCTRSGRLLSGALRTAPDSCSEL